MSLDLHEASRRRAGMVDRLTAEGVLTDSLLRDALLRLPREVLLPHAYVRVSGPGADPIDWRLLDGSHPDDCQEWLDLIHSNESILLQRDGEPLDALPRGLVTGGHMTSMSTYTPATIEALQAMELGSGQRYLELGSGPGVSLALAAAITGPGLATGVERDGHMAAFAQRNLDRLGVGAEAIEGDALEGHEARAPYDRIHSGIGVPCVPAPWVEQLALGGRLLTTLATRTPSWPGQLLVTRTADGRVEALLRGQPRGYRPLLGYRWLNAVDHRARIKDDPGTARITRLTPPSDEAYGFWLAAAYLAPGLVRDFQAETMTIVAPEDDSWAVAGPGDGTVRVHGPRDVWAELENVHARWEQAGRPEQYRVDLRDSIGAQHVTSGTGPKALAWTLPPLAACPGRCHDHASWDRRRTARSGPHRPGGGGQPAQALPLPPAHQPHTDKELRVSQPPNPLHLQAVSPAMPSGWAETFLRHRAGDGCPMCANDYAADDIGWGLLLRRGEVANAYLWRSGRLRGYCVLIHRGAPHVAEPTDLSEADAAAYWRDTLALGRALTAFYEPVKLNFSTLGNVVPHLHSHICPRYAGGTDPAPGGPLPWSVLDNGRQDEAQLQADAAALRELLEGA